MAQTVQNTKLRERCSGQMFGVCHESRAKRCCRLTLEQIADLHFVTSLNWHQLEWRDAELFAKLVELEESVIRRCQSHIFNAAACLAHQMLAQTDVFQVMLGCMEECK